jgi:hypothetical protein
MLKMRPIIKLIKPDLTEFSLYVAVGFGILVLSNIQKLYDYFAAGVSFETIRYTNDFAYEIESRLLGLEAKIDPRFADFTVWLIVGFISVMVMLYAQRVIQEAEEERIYAKLIKDNRTKKHQITDYLMRVAVRTTGLILLFMWLRIYFGAVFVTLSKSFFENATKLPSPVALLVILVSVLLSAVCLYAFAICFRLIALKTRVFTNR